MRTRMLLVLFSLVLTQVVAAQNKFTINYHRIVCTTLDSVGKPVPRTILHEAQSTLAIADSFSYYWQSSPSNKETRLPSPLGKKFFWHSIFTNNVSLVSISQAEPRDKPKFRIKENIQPSGWKVLDEYKEVLNHRCRKAVRVTGEDSTIAWFSPELPAVFGPGSTRGLPGTVLEADIFYPSGIHLVKALKITVGGQPIIEPADGKIISLKEYNEVVKKLQ